jgi:hypothetical protein
MPRFLPVIVALALACFCWPAAAQHVGVGALPSVTSAAEPARLCGTNSSRSRRCYFGNKECLRNGHSQANCDRALAVCHSCIVAMVACARETSTSCATCQERYGSCMQLWVDLIK